MWSFDPGARTPLQYYMQNTLHATDAQCGQFSAIAFACFLPPLLLYGWLCRRLRLGTLLFWGTVIGIPQYLPLLFIHSVTGALMGAAFVGLTGGVATAAYYDLMIRSCPRGLQGTMLMASVALQSIDARFGDVLGAWLYQSTGGFASCAWAITGVYALILPVLLLVPKRLTATMDGEAVGAG
jgi:MFS family permease